MKARLKNVVISGIVICTIVFLWILTVTREGKQNLKKLEDGGYQAILEDRFSNLRDKLRDAELLNRQRENDMQILRSQFNYLVQLLSSNQTNNRTMAEKFPTIMKSTGSNISEQIGSLHLPSIFTYLPHLTGHPESLKPVYKLSMNRYGTSIVMGIPTIRREKIQYLAETVKSLIEGMTEEEKNICLIIVFVAEPWDEEYAFKVGEEMKDKFPQSIESGLLEVIAPPENFYPDMDHLKLTFGDTKERVRWRTKQNLDFSFLMLYARTRGFYYVQLEDDVIAKPGYISVMKTYADQQTNDDWLLLEFSALGFIGKLFKSSNLPFVVEFFLMFHKDKPIDWLLDHLLWVKVCSPEKDPKHCDRMKAEVRKRFKPSLFQHVGTQSSLRGKTQKLKDKDFGKQAIFRAHVNPVASVHTTIKAYQKFFLKKAYIGEDVFWGLAPTEGDTVEFRFDPPIEIASYLFRSGHQNHPDDKFTNTIVEINPESDDVNHYIQVGDFNSAGIATTELDPKYGKIAAIRLKVLQSSENWVVLSEIHIIERKKKR